MTFANYRVRLAIGTILGDGVRSFTLESVTPELTTLRGTPEGRRQTQDASVGARRAIPTSLILDLVSAIESGRASLNDIYRTHRREQGLPPLLEFLGLDHDPFLMGYDSTIYKICQHLLSNVDAQESRNEDQRDFLIPKPFLLLAGISGTGKTRWVTDRAIEGKNNVKVIAVRPDWHEPSDLLGYVSRISSPPTFVAASGFPAFLLEAWRDSWCAEPSLNPSPNAVLRMTPHWLCLDEMNLAPVEQYFADYLSVLEERKWTTRGYRCPPLLKLAGAEDEVRAFLRLAESDPLWQAFLEVGGIPLPANLVVVGTVNMDETTHVFSRKVLDRALTVEFDEVDFGAFGGTALTSQRKGLPWTALSAVTDANDLDPPTKKRGSETAGRLERDHGEWPVSYCVPHHQREPVDRRIAGRRACRRSARLGDYDQASASPGGG